VEVGTSWSGWGGAHRIFGVSASVNLPLHHRVQKFPSVPALPSDPGKRAVKWLCVCVLFFINLITRLNYPVFGR